MKTKIAILLSLAVIATIILFACGNSRPYNKIKLGDAINGVVELPAGTFNIKNLTINNNSSLIGSGSEVTTLNVAGTITMKDDSHLKGVKINCADDFEGNAVTLDGSSYIEYVMDMLDDVYFKCGTATGTALYLEAIANDGGYHFVAVNHFGAIFIEGFEYGIRLYCRETDGTAYITGNVWKYVGGYNVKNLIEFDNDANGGVAKNEFTSIQYQWGVNSVTGVHIDSTSHYNRFLSAVIWDSGSNCFVIDEGSAYNYICGGNIYTEITDNGYKTFFIGRDGILYLNGVARW